MNKQILLYSLKVWLTVAVLTPVLIFLISELAAAGADERVVDEIGLGVFCSLLISLPGALLFLFAVSLVSKLPKSVVYKKILLSIIGCCVSLPVIYLFLFNVLYFEMYCGPVIIGSVWLYRLMPANQIPAV